MLTLYLALLAECIDFLSQNHLESLTLRLKFGLNEVWPAKQTDPPKPSQFLERLPAGSTDCFLYKCKMLQGQGVKTKLANMLASAANACSHAPTQFQVPSAFQTNLHFLSNSGLTAALLTDSPENLSPHYHRHYLRLLQNVCVKHSWATVWLVKQRDVVKFSYTCFFFLLWWVKQRPLTAFYSDLRALLTNAGKYWTCSEYDCLNYDTLSLHIFCLPSSRWQDNKQYTVLLRP